jgi:integrase
MKCVKMFKQPKIFIPAGGGRAYVLYYFNGKRIREYNGNRLNLNIHPNRCDNLRAKKEQLALLQFEVTKALKGGWSPFQVEDQNLHLSLREALSKVIEEKNLSNLSKLYKRNLVAVHRLFVSHISSTYLDDLPDKLPLYAIEEFLNRFHTSERNYINRRRCLHTIFNELVRKGYLQKNLVKVTKSAKPKASLHVPYTREQLNKVLEFLKPNYPNLHLCCLLTYGCLLRPHHEIRLLKLKHFDSNFSQIQLAGNENKSKRVRTVYVPDYLRETIMDKVMGIDDQEVNIFTLTHEVYSYGYFNVMWTQAKRKMIEAGILNPKQTIYSFRHTAAISVYRNTKDLHILQQLLQHSNMIVTLNYLRGLGETNDERLREFMPQL